MGCSVYVDAFDPRCLYYVESWAEARDMEREVHSERFTRLLSVMEAAAKEPVLEFHFVSQRRGLDFVEEVRNRVGAGERERLGRSGPL